MSTKIYEAYRIPINKYNDFANWFKETGTKEMVKYFWNIIGNMKPEDMCEIVLEHCDDTSDQYDAISALLHHLYKEAVLPASTSNEKSPVDPDFGFWAFPNGKYLYIIPNIPQWMVYDLWSLGEYPEYAEDYSYWNNTDKPDEISNNEWRKRGRKWDELLGNSLYFTGLNARASMSDFIFPMFHYVYKKESE